MKKKRMTKVLMYIMCLFFGMQTLPVDALAQIGSTAEERDIKHILEFCEMPDEERNYYYIREEKPDIETLFEQFPKTLDVFIEGETETRAIEVTWYCVGDDYTGSDSWYYQFSPVWDETKYVTEDMDVIQDAPYIAVHLMDSGGISAWSVTSNSNETVIYDFLRSEVGLNAAAACGVLANIYCESGFNPNAIGDNGTSYGICQWHNTRWEAMKNWCESNGYDWTTLTGQLYYLKFELSQNNYLYLWNGKSIFDYIISVSDTAEGAYQAGYHWCYEFERPANAEAKSATRGNLARDKYWAEYGKPFVDVNENDYFYVPVVWALENNITAGYSTGEFAPNDACTRAQIVSFLWRAAGCPEPETTDTPFTDVTEGEYYYKAVLWAVENGITAGLTSTEYGPGEVCTRAQAVAFLWRYYGSPEITAENPFVDVAEGEYYYDAVLWAVENGITAGINATEFAPNAMCTRGQIMCFLYRAMAE